MTILGVTESFKMMKMMEEGGGEQGPPPSPQYWPCLHPPNEGSAPLDFFLVFKNIIYFYKMCICQFMYENII